MRANAEVAGCPATVGRRSSASSRSRCDSRPRGGRRWLVQREVRRQRLELIAHRLGGPGSFPSDSAPIVEAVATFLRAVSRVTRPRQMSLIASRRIAFQLANSGPIRRGPPGLCRYAALVYSDRPGRAGSFWPSVHGEADYHPDDEKSDHDDSGDYPLHLDQPSSHSGLGPIAEMPGYSRPGSGRRRTLSR
jgi:hypothetical protein